MGFFAERCPNCGKSISKNADFCNACGCPSATGWNNCTSCGASVGSDSRFCWKCGVEQSADARRQIYEDRWRRSPTDFAVRVDLSIPEKVLHHGLQVDNGTMGLLFQDGRFIGSLEPGYHSFTNFFQRLLNMDKGKEAHAVLIDITAAEVDFILENIVAQNQTPVDVRIRLLFRLTDAQVFTERLLRQAATFSTEDLVRAFHGDVATGLQQFLADKELTSLVCEVRERELVEQSLVDYLRPILGGYGLEIEGVRLAEFGGQALNSMREKLGEIARLNRELELNRKLRDAVRAEKLDAYRDEEQLRDSYEQMTHEFGFKSAEREQEQKLFVQVGEHQVQAEALRQDYDLRRAEIVNRLDEQVLRHQSELADVQAEVERGAVRFTEDVRRQEVTFKIGQGQQITQAETDLEVGKKGIELLRLVKDAKLEARQKEDDHDLNVEARRLEMRGNASMQALLATISGEQADRLLKLAELEMRKGLTAEQAIAMVVEKSPEIAPSLAEALKARYNSQTPPTAT